MKTIREHILDGEILISDGAWGTMLQAKGLTPGECPEAWCLSHRRDVFDIARQYVQAGADLIETNSFGASRIKLDHYNLGDKATEINTAAASISREAAGPNRHVIASVGPTGKLLMTGDISEQELYRAFEEQVSALSNGGADAICIETMSAIDEACCAVKAAREATSLEVICTFTFEHTVDGDYRTMMGITPEMLS